MLKRSLAAGLLACAALTPVAFAQDKQASSGGGKIQFIQTIEAQQFRGSELMGQTVYNDQDEAIGDIGDALLDKNGQVSAVIIDVGGFLGIGAREVGVPFNALRFERAPETTASTGAGASDPSNSAAQDARSSTGGPPPTAGSGAAPNPSGSANTGTGGAAQRAAQGQSSGTMSGQIASANQSSQEATSQSTLDDVRIVLNTTRDELQNAPEIKNPGEQSQESGASGGSGSGASGSGAPAK
jgi:sporulation protein YlmC with PRC-barrel domain